MKFVWQDRVVLRALTRPKNAIKPVQEACCPSNIAHILNSPMSALTINPRLLAAAILNQLFLIHSDRIHTLMAS